jgi:hypothetical protein
MFEFAGPFTKEELDKLITTDEFNKPFNDYIQAVKKEARKDLSAEDAVLYDKIIDGEMRSQKDGKELYEWAPKVYNAVMWSIGMGLG